MFKVLNESVQERLFHRLGRLGGLLEVLEVDLVAAAVPAPQLESDLLGDIIEDLHLSGHA